MDFPKKQQQCLIPRYLLQYLQDLQISHNDPTAPWGGGGGGGSYTAGDGIDITNDVISIDDTVALKTDLLDYVTTSELTTELSNYVTSTDLATELLDYAELSDLATVATTGDYNDLLNKPTIPVVPTNISAFTNDSGYITSSALSGYATQSWVLNQGYVKTGTAQTISGDKTFSGSTVFTGETSYQGNYYNVYLYRPGGAGVIVASPIEVDPDQTWFSGIYPGSIQIRGTTGNVNIYPDALESHSEYKIILKLGRDTIGEYTFKNKTGDVAVTSEIPDAVSGTNDGTNWTSLTIGSNTYGLAGGSSSYTAGTGIDITNNTIAIDSTVVALKSDIPSLTGYATQSWVTSQGYSTFSGSYNDLTNKPTIPTISGNYSGSYWTSININGTTKSIPSGGSTPTNMVTTNTAQNITGTKTFVGDKRLAFKQSGTSQVLGFTAYNNNNYEVGNLQIANRTVSGNSNMYVTLGNYSSLTSKAKVGFRLQPNNSSDSFNFVMPYGTTTEFTSNTYSRLSDTTIPCAFTDGTTIVKADATGLVNISSISGGGGGGTTVSGTNDGTNWTSITIGSDTYGIPSGGGSSQLYVMVEVVGEVQDQDENVTYFNFSLIADISNMTINDAKELYNNNNANYDFATSAATYPSEFNYGFISFSDGTGEHHIDSIAYDSVNEIVTLNYNDGSPKTFTFSESELTQSYIESIANL